MTFDVCGISKVRVEFQAVTKIICRASAICNYLRNIWVKICQHFLAMKNDELNKSRIDELPIKFIIPINLLLSPIFLAETGSSENMKARCVM